MLSPERLNDALKGGMKNIGPNLKKKMFEKVMDIYRCE